MKVHLEVRTHVIDGAEGRGLGGGLTISMKRERLSLSLKFFGVGYGPWILKD